MKSVISIIIPTFNRSQIISHTLDSVSSQTFQDWECIVVDDFSTDDTKTVVEEYCNRDSRFKYIVNSHTKGAQGARNTGLFESESDWVFFLDSDNRMHNDFLEIMLNELNPGIDVCHCFSTVIDSSTGMTIGSSRRVVEGHIYYDLFDGKTYVDFNQEIIRRKKMIEIGGLDEECPSLQEFDTNIRLSQIATYHTIQKELVDYYFGGNDTISCNYKKQVLGKMYILCKYKKKWLENKKNADRLIYEAIDKLKHAKPLSFQFKCLCKLALVFPEMIFYYVKKNASKVFRK